MSDLHDARAERIVAGWLLNCEEAGSGSDWQRAADITPDHFSADSVAREAFAVAAQLHAAGKAVGFESVASSERVTREDLAILTGWKDAQTSFYFADSLATLRETHKHQKRVTARLALAQAIERDEGIGEAYAALARIDEDAVALAAVPIMEIPTADTAHRATVNLLGNGFLRRGQGGLVNGPTGVGKSVLLEQGAFCWACGRDFFGIRPEHPLVVLLVQSENDDEDLVEMRDGILAGLAFTAEERDLIRKNVFTVRSFKSGLGWLREIEPLMVKHRPDILLADPLFAYAGVDVAKDQPGLSAFLREMVQPFIIKHACGIIFAHHTNKPPSGKEKPNWQAGDYAYAGSGHNELANWPRFVAVLRSLGSRTVFELRIGKRWKRAGICDTNGQPTDRVLIQHSDTGICWKTATDQDLARTVETAGATARTVAAVDADEVIVRAFNACAKKGRADIETVAKRCKFSEKTLRRRFKDEKGIPRLVRSGDDVLTIANSQVVAVETEVQDDLAA